MSCYYEIDGHRFNSELELDDFLMEKYPFKSSLGDIVYSENGHVLKSVDKLKQISEEADKITAWNNRIRVWDDDGKTYTYKNPYIGVNAFLSRYTDAEGHPLFPIFKEENYWAIRRGLWNKGDFTEDEQEVFFGEENPVPITENYDYYRKLMEEKWESQCLYGDAIHAVFELFFSGNQTTYNNISDRTFTRKDGTSVKFSELMSKTKYDEAVEKAKQIKQQLETELGDNLKFYPEFKITGKLNTSTNENIDTLLGYIDLLVVDNKGNIHIIDYKTSPKSIDKYSLVKLYTYQYQLATYGRMLSLSGFSTDKTKYLIIPVLLNEFKKVNDKYEYSNLNLPDGIFQNISNEIRSRVSLNNNLDDIIKVEYKSDVSTDNLLTSVVKAMQEWFPRYKVFKTITEKEVIEELKLDNAFKKNPETDRYEWTPKGTHNYIIWANSEEELTQKVLKHKEQLTRRRRDITVGVREALIEAIKNGTTEGIKFARLSLNFIGLNKDWLRLQMKKYANDNWRVLDDSSFDGLLEFGMILLLNKNTGQIDVVKCSTNNLKYTRNLSNNGKTTNLAGVFHNDVYYASNKDAYMLESATGNIELMESMLVLNKLYNLFGNNSYVGNIHVINPSYGTGVSASNKELQYCFNELYRNKELDEVNHFKNGDIKLATLAQIVKTRLADIISQGSEENWSDRWSGFKNFNSCKSLLDAAIDTSYEEQIKALQQLAKLLESSFGEKLDLLHINLESASSEEVELYNYTLLALAQLRNINFRQQLSDHSKWVESLLIFGNKGLSGNYIDNPGNLLSLNLNILTKLVTEAYLGVRSDILDLIPELQLYVNKLKQDKGFNTVKSSTIGNLADLYSRMFRITADGDWLARNPWTDSTLTEAEKDFLKYFLKKVNDNRFAHEGGDSSEYVQQLRDSDSVEYFRIPLTIGDNASRLSTDGLLPALKNRLRGWIPSEALKRARDKSTRFVKDLQRVEGEPDVPAEEEANLFEFVNNFDRGNSDLRMEMLSRNGESYYEHNLETLLLKHEFAYSMKDHVDSVFPAIKAALIHLTVMGNQQNTKFLNDLHFGAEYVKNKIKGESIVENKYQKAAEFSGKLRGLASKMVLGFSPVQFGYLMIQGLWNDIRLIVLDKQTGKEVFTLLNMLQAGKIVYRDLFRMDGEDSVISKLNGLYGINDMDINTYIDRVKSDLFGLMNFSNFLMRFTSRPDYYNRMTIFVAKMIAEGSFDAHSLDKDGRLKYDFREDKRFERYINNDKSDINLYNQQRVLYLAMAKLFMDEGTLDRDTWKEGDPLPRAYTNTEAESMKSLGDTIYGYYSSEKKSMIHSGLLGGMFMQFKTYWSGKKNQYLSGGKVALEGHWEQYEENGKKYYYQVDDKGNILWNEPPTTEETAAPMMIWKGDWKEGIMQTITDIFWRDPRTWKETYLDKWNNEDPNLRTTYRNNITQLFYDVIMFAALGPILAAVMNGWYNDEKKNASKDDMNDALYLSAINIARLSLKNSFLDFNFIQSIGEPGVVWNPFALTWFTEQSKNVFKFATGDMNIIDLLVKSNSAMKQTKPVWNTLKSDK